MKTTMTIYSLVYVVSTILLATLSPTTQGATFPYVNDFTSTGLTHVNEEGDGAYTLDTGAGVLNFSKAADAATGTSSTGEEISGVGGSNFVMSARFTVNDLDLAGSLSITTGFATFSSTSSFSSSTGTYYLADWGIGGTSGLGNLRILSLGGADSGFSSNNGNSGGGGEIGETYELRLTGTHTGSTLNMTLALLDDEGNQLGTAATATDTVPLAGQFFGLRHRPATTAHFIDIDHHNFSVVPEPSSIVLTIAAVMGMACLSRKSFRKEKLGRGKTLIQF